MLAAESKSQSDDEKAKLQSNQRCAASKSPALLAANPHERSSWTMRSISAGSDTVSTATPAEVSSALNSSSGCG